MTGDRRAVTFLHVAVAVFDGDGKILLVRQAYRERVWSLPGGGVNAGESPADAAIREVREEAGVIVHIDHLIGVYSAPAREMLSLCFRGTLRGQEIWSPDWEIIEKGWFDARRMPQPMSRRMSQRIMDAFADMRGVFRVDFDE